MTHLATFNQLLITSYYLHSICEGLGLVHIWHCREGFLTAGQGMSDRVEH